MRNRYAVNTDVPDSCDELEYLIGIIETIKDEIPEIPVKDAAFVDPIPFLVKLDNIREIIEEAEKDE